MSYDFPKSVFYRTFMTAVFVGIAATLVTIVYDLLFVRIYGFPLSAIINVSSLIFGVNLVFLIIGILYYLFIASFKHGDTPFIILLITVTVILAWRSGYAHRSNDPEINHQFRSLLTGIVIIMGAMAAFLLPYLYHNKKFEDAVL